MDLHKVQEQLQKALDEFARGNPEPTKKFFSHRDDVILANPFGPAVCGWKQVSDTLDFAASRFRDGEMTEVKTVARYETRELVTVYEIESWKAKVAGRNEITPFELRVTSTWRLEDNDWKLVHRHADPIAKPHPDGPLRPTGN